jgi:hypothetical protein
MAVIIALPALIFSRVPDDTSNTVIRRAKGVDHEILASRVLPASCFWRFCHLHRAADQHALGGAHQL